MEGEENEGLEKGNEVGRKKVLRGRRNWRGRRGERRGRCRGRGGRKGERKGVEE